MKRQILTTGIHDIFAQSGQRKVMVKKLTPDHHPQWLNVMWQVSVFVDGKAHQPSRRQCLIVTKPGSQWLDTCIEGQDKTVSRYVMRINYIEIHRWQPITFKCGTNLCCFTLPTINRLAVRPYYTNVDAVYCSLPTRQKKCVNVISWCKKRY